MKSQQKPIFQEHGMKADTRRLPEFLRIIRFQIPQKDDKTGRKCFIKQIKEKADKNNGWSKYETKLPNVSVPQGLSSAAERQKSLSSGCLESCPVRFKVGIYS
ncbi:hypothetical protein XENOCAPTIV_028812 [Xenoophorus captivus]|uniref:Uncharacterized protein n=1 Tax=Xenoophorus captivus TaxID=1517983 RepID=A0ABV0RSC8_9TELE